MPTLTEKDCKSPCINCEPISTNLCCYCVSPTYEMFEPRQDTPSLRPLHYKRKQWTRQRDTTCKTEGCTNKCISSNLCSACYVARQRARKKSSV